MEIFGADFLSAASLPGQDALMGSIWGNVTALDSSASLMGVLSAIRATGSGAFTSPQLEPFSPVDDLSSPVGGAKAITTADSASTLQTLNFLESAAFASNESGTVQTADPGHDHPQADPGHDHPQADPGHDHAHDVSLDFSAAFGTVLDKNGEGTGFTSVQRNTAGTEYDASRVDLNTTAGTLTLTGTKGSNAGSTNTLKNALQLPMEGTHPFTVSTRLKGPLTNLTTAYQQGGIFLGPNQDNFVKLVIVNSSTSSGTSGLGLQFHQEQNGVRSNVGGSSGSQVTGLNWASINTLDLFLKGDSATGVITAAYRVNSDTATPTLFTQQFRPSSPSTFFTSEATARAGILAQTTNAADTPVTFDEFNIQYGVEETPPPPPPPPGQNIKVNFQPNSAAVPTGYTKDIGAAYSDTRGFGWVRQDSLSSATHVALDIQANARERNRTGVDQRLDTLIHMQFPTTTTNTTAVKIPAAWEYALANGTYSVTVGVGDQSGTKGYDSQHSINVEGFNAINRFQGSSTQEYKQATTTVDVTDGKLTIDALGGTNTKINYIDIASGTTPPPPPPPNPGSTTVNWSTVASQPIGRTEAQGEAVDGKLYVFGGYTDTTFVPKTKRSDVYDSATNTWKRIADLPIATTHAGVAVDGRDIYLAGGVTGTDAGEKLGASTDVWKYNVDANTWTAATPLPEARGAGELSLLGRELHYFGGSGFNRDVPVGDHWVLNLDGGTSWTPAAPLPNPRTHLADAVIGGKIYAIGGEHGFNRTATAQDDVHAWDPTSNTWTEVASLPRGLSHIASQTVVVNDRIIVTGGETAFIQKVMNVSAYDPQANSWTSLTPLAESASQGVAGSIENQIFYARGNLKTTTFKGVPVT